MQIHLKTFNLSPGISLLAISKPQYNTKAIKKFLLSETTSSFQPCLSVDISTSQQCSLTYNAQDLYLLMYSPDYLSGQPLYFIPEMPFALTFASQVLMNHTMN